MGTGRQCAGRATPGRDRFTSLGDRNHSVTTHEIRVGCAGWSIPKPHAGRFPEEV